MSPAPVSPKIYHITHVDNLARMAREGVLWSDARRIDLGLEREVVGMSEIKKRRLTELQVKCHPGTMVGEYVPFYLCPRSIMLYILHRGNHPDVTYRGGQGPIVHLVADMRATVAWADAQGRPWAFSNRNAGAYLADFYDDLQRLDEVNWNAVEATGFRDSEVKEGKQAEFLVFESFPWELVQEIGVIDLSVEAQVQALLQGSRHRPDLRVRRTWYY